MENNLSWMKDQKIKEYFDGLPEYVKENIVQGTIPFSTREEMEQCAKNIREKQSLE